MNTESKPEMVSVPRAPTLEMLQAAVDQGFGHHMAMVLWNLMLAATPAPAAPQESDGGKLIEAYEAQWQMKNWAQRAHALCNELRIKYPNIAELSDDGVLHCAIHSILGVNTPHAAPMGHQTAHD